MKKLFAPLALGLVLFSTQSTMATAKDCSQVIKGADAYKGVVASVSKVTVKKVAGKDALLHENGIRYDFSYTYPNGYVGKTWTVTPADSQYKIENGDKMIWILGTELVRAKYPNEDPRVPAIVNRSCNVFSIDFSTPAKQIAGI